MLTQETFFREIDPDDSDDSDDSDNSDDPDGGSGAKTLLPLERWCFPVGSRSYLARPLAVGTAAGIFFKSMGLPAPHPGQVRDLHRAEIA